MNSLKGNNSWLGGITDNTIYYHATDHLKQALHTLRNDKKGDQEFRIVVFIDDLDRCTPEKGLQVIESIKGFFDIEGIIYVIGMNYNTINDIIKTKYGNDNPTIGGFEYMQKIVQLPFQIPTWELTDISDFINDVISKGLKGSELIKEFEKNKELIVKAIQLNPREAKRFINDIILACSVFENLAIDELIVVRALTFRHEWNDFLEFISPDKFRKEFLIRYINQFGLDEVREKIKNVNHSFYENIEPLVSKNLDELKDKILIVYKQFFDENNPLVRFLNGEAIILLSKITNMGKYRRALEAVTSPQPNAPPNALEFLVLLQKGSISNFNVRRAETNFTPLDFKGVNLRGSILHNADLRDVKLDGANLEKSHLDGANLLRSSLRGADLEKASLKGANLENTEIKDANLKDANLEGAKLIGVNLNEAANLKGIRGVNLKPPPSIVAVIPKDKSQNVPINTSIIARFSEPIQSWTISSNTFTLSDSDNKAIAGTVVVTPDALTVNFTPAKLSYKTQYTATITTGVTDKTGIPMLFDKTWSFTTEESTAGPKMRKEDKTPPTVLSTSPGDGDNRVPTDSLVTASFNNRMNASTINTDTFTVEEKATKRRIDGKVGTSSDHKNAIFSPEKLEAGKDYSARIDTAVKDEADNALTIPQIWSFKTK